MSKTNKKVSASIIIAIIFTIIVAIFGGLKLYNQFTKLKEDPNKKKYGDGEYYELEEWEKSFLTNDEYHFVTEQEKERVAVGYLSFTQVKELEKVRIVSKILKERHPNYNCTIIDKGYDGMLGSMSYDYFYKVEGFSDFYTIKTEDYIEFYNDTFKIDQNND